MVQVFLPVLLCQLFRQCMLMPIPPCPLLRLLPPSRPRPSFIVPPRILDAVGDELGTA